jgi:hypothetical protein
MKKIALIILTVTLFYSCQNQEQNYELQCILETGEIVSVGYAENKEVVSTLIKGTEVALKPVFNNSNYVLLGSEEQYCITNPTDSTYVSGIVIKN